jgi:hypothetical protein
MKALIFAVMIFSSTSATAGWVGGANPNHLVSPGQAGIAYVPDKGQLTFEDALRTLVRDGHIGRLESVALHWLVQDLGFQSELIAALQYVAPEDLAAAQHSAGNIQNPEMVQLRRSLSTAVLSTPTAKSINTSLSRYGLHVSGVEHEKLTFVGPPDNRRLMCFLWLKISPLSAPARPNNSFKPKPKPKPLHGSD